MMFDPRVKKLAQVLVHYSLEIQPGWKFIIQTNPLAEDLALAVYEEALKKGAYPQILCGFDQAEEIFYKCASKEQLEYISPIHKLVIETYDARLSIGAEQNTRSLSAVDPERQSIRQKAWRPIFQTFMERAAKRELRWSLTEYPT